MQTKVMIEKMGDRGNPRWTIIEVQCASGEAKVPFYFKLDKTSFTMTLAATS